MIGSSFLDRQAGRPAHGLSAPMCLFRLYRTPKSTSRISSFGGRSAGRWRLLGHQQPVLADDERDADDQRQRVADGLGQKDAVDAPQQREQINKGDEEHDLPQQRDEDGGQGLG